MEGHKMAVPNTTEIVATTMKLRSPEIYDSVTNNNPLFKKLKDKGNARPYPGGSTIEETITYANNSGSWYSGFDVIDISPANVITSATYAMKQYAIPVSISGEDELKNSGEAAVFDLVYSRIKNAEQQAANDMNTAVYSDGTGDGGKQLGGLQLLVPDDPTTGTVGGINRATYTWWRPYKYAGVADGGGAVSASNIQKYMHQVYINTTRGADFPDCIIADNTYYNLFWQSLVAIQRIQQEDKGGLGFNELMFKGASVYLGGGYGGASPSAHMYFLNTNHIHLRNHPKRNFTPIGPNERYSVNQDAKVMLMGWAGALTLTNSFVHGVLIA